jgi:hypothetical protein
MRLTSYPTAAYIAHAPVFFIFVAHEETPTQIAYPPNKLWQWLPMAGFHWYSSANVSPNCVSIIEHESPLTTV